MKRIPPPPVIGRVESGRTCYVDGRIINDVVSRKAGQCWQYAGRYTTAMYNDGGGRTTLKNLAQWQTGTAPPDPDEIGATLEEARRAGVYSPSCWSDLFHRYYPPHHPAWPSRRGVRTVSALLKAWRRGPWEQRWSADLGAVLEAPAYDMMSAYAWGAAQGLPCEWHPAETMPERGITWGVWELPAGRYPRPLRPGPVEAALSSEERDCYGARLLEHYYSVRWETWFDFRPLLSAIQCAFPTAWKKTMRGFWGSWHGIGAPTRLEFDAGRLRLIQVMPTGRQNLAWSHYVLSRPAMRLYQVAQQALQVYVDCVWTYAAVRVGGALGDFRQKGRSAARPCGSFVTLKA